ncbi:hypothetical protein GOP47_0020783 [Adiantum capillus-veneris]|uniref:NADH:flavin oxidoreductase/NADH oxidase N-terminal domain-containing protein n=1 Tax=Adiantum capillus-veneris TaxID=13818 RepID=A0A9D4UAR7_ADICA|nr:hypothetical protein GOP47_0020783 [Adiantum capillus-veneris]
MHLGCSIKLANNCDNSKCCCVVLQSKSKLKLFKKAGMLPSIEPSFDGVKVHRAHGYLLDQCMKNSLNGGQTPDEYGRSLENRFCSSLEVVRVVSNLVY